MSGHKVRRVAWFELEIVAFEIVLDTVPPLVKQVHMLIDLYHF